MCAPWLLRGGRQAAPLAVNAGAVVAAAQAAEVALRLAAPCALAVAAAGLSRVADALATLVFEGLPHALCYTRAEDSLVAGPAAGRGVNTHGEAPRTPGAVHNWERPGTRTGTRTRDEEQGRGQG